MTKETYTMPENYMHNFTIRYAKSSDYEMVENIMKQVQQLHIDWRPDIYKTCETVLPKEEFEEAVQEGQFVVAEQEEKVVGLLSFLVRHVESKTQVTRDVLFVDSMAVDEKFRGQGIGRALFDFAKEIVAERKLDGFELQVNARNKKAMEMYKKYGFTEKSINMELLK